jgi:hypothetical protein
MRITVFTSNQPRHLSLIRRLSRITEVGAVMECSTVFPGERDDFFHKSPVMQRYFKRVMDAEREVFGDPEPAKCEVLPLKMGDLPNMSVDALKPMLRAATYIVFGSSWIRGPLCEYLTSRNAINIHMGIAPEYRGSSCNFWAAYDGNPHLVGATLHRLTEGLDSGPILETIKAPMAHDPFLRGMLAVKAAHESVANLLIAGFGKGEPQDKGKQIRYSRNADFTDEVAEEFLERAGCHASP